MRNLRICCDGHEPECSFDHLVICLIGSFGDYPHLNMMWTIGTGQQMLFLSAELASAKVLNKQFPLWSCWCFAPSCPTVRQG